MDDSGRVAQNFYSIRPPMIIYLKRNKINILLFGQDLYYYAVHLSNGTNVIIATDVSYRSYVSRMIHTFSDN